MSSTIFVWFLLYAFLRWWRYHACEHIPTTRPWSCFPSQLCDVAVPLSEVQTPPSLLWKLSCPTRIWVLSWYAFSLLYLTNHWQASATLRKLHLLDFQTTALVCWNRRILPRDECKIPNRTNPGWVFQPLVYGSLVDPTHLHQLTNVFLLCQPCRLRWTCCVYLACPDDCNIGWVVLSWFYAS